MTHSSVKQGHPFPKLRMNDDLLGLVLVLVCMFKSYNTFKVVFSAPNSGLGILLVTKAGKEEKNSTNSFHLLSNDPFFTFYLEYQRRIK